MFAVQADGSDVTTIEGLATNGQLHPVQQGFWECHGLQCGFCTPGMIMASVHLLAQNASPSRERDRPRPARQPVPLHRLFAHHRRRRSRRRAGRTAAAGSRRRWPVADAKTTPYVGRAMKRVEDPRLIKGIAHLRRRSAAAGTAARGDPAQPVRARAHHAHRHRRGAGRSGRRRRCFTGADVNDACGLVPVRRGDSRPQGAEAHRARRRSRLLRRPRGGGRRRHRSVHRARRDRRRSTSTTIRCRSSSIPEEAVKPARR